MSQRPTPRHDHAQPTTTIIDKRDFDAHRSLLSQSQDGNDEDGDHEQNRRRRLSLRRSIALGEGSSSSEREDGEEEEEDGLLHDVVETIVERDRRRLKREITRGVSFVWSVISWYKNKTRETFPGINLYIG